MRYARNLKHDAVRMGGLAQNTVVVIDIEGPSSQMLQNALWHCRLACLVFEYTQESWAYCVGLSTSISRSSILPSSIHAAKRTNTAVLIRVSLGVGYRY